MEAYISTFSNKKFHFLNPSEDEICINDIAHALGMLCRFSGHVKHFYSVAEHSVLVADFVLAETGDYREAFSALMHDASEAYLTDIPRPIKPHIVNYKQYEALAEKTIQRALGFDTPTPFIKYVDTHICATEAKQLFVTPPTWCEEIAHIDVTIKCWTPEEAKEVFLQRYSELKQAAA